MKKENEILKKEDEILNEVESPKVESKAPQWETPRLVPKQNISVDIQDDEINKMV